MIALLWNVQGIGNPWTRMVLRRHVTRFSPEFVFLSETKLYWSQVERLKFPLGFSDDFVIERVGMGGGLTFLWKDQWDIEILGYSRGHTDAKIVEEDHRSWLFVGFYGNLDTNLWRHLWELLIRLNTGGTKLWLCNGDFKEILYAHEKHGGNMRSSG